MLIFTFFGRDWKYPFGKYHFVQESKTVRSGETQCQFQYAEFDGDVHFFLFGKIGPNYQNRCKFLFRFFNLTMGSSVCLGKLVKIPENASVFQSSFVTYNTEKDNMFLQPDVLRNRIEQEYM